MYRLDTFQLLTSPSSKKPGRSAAGLDKVGSTAVVETEFSSQG